MTENRDKRVCLGAVAGAHGVKGDLRIKSFTDIPENVAAYGPVTSEDGKRRFTLKVIRTQQSSVVIARAAEVADRDDAQSLKGVRLYVERSVLPAPEEDEFYLDDLVGLEAVDETGAPLGRVSAVYNFGAGDLIELKNIPDIKGARLISFTKHAVPAVDLKAGRLTVRRESLDQDSNEADPLADKAFIEASIREEDA